jgi:RNAse (barnase) inhibitor barstar
VIRFSDIEKRLDQQYMEDAKQLWKNYSEQNKLRPSVIRFHDLEREAKAREERMARVVMLLGDEKFADTRRELLKGSDVSKEIVVSVDEKLPLWLAMKAIVEQTMEIQVVDLQDALEYFGIKASRQAIESALASHKETFETKTRNRDKFVSLKR